MVPSIDTVHSESMVGIIPGDSGVVIEYQVDALTHTLSVGWFVSYFHIYPGFMGEVSLLTTFYWNQGLRIIPF